LGVCQGKGRGNIDRKNREENMWLIRPEQDKAIPTCGGIRNCLGQTYDKTLSACLKCEKDAFIAIRSVEALRVTEGL
jgi:hypothetical protein